MATIREFIQNLLYQVPAIGISDIVDILVVSIIFYSLLRLIRSTSAARVARAILLLLAITLLTDVLNLYTLNWLLNKILEVGAIALIIVFQPELRRALERVGRDAEVHERVAQVGVVEAALLPAAGDVAGQRHAAVTERDLCNVARDVAAEALLAVGKAEEAAALHVLVAELVEQRLQRCLVDVIELEHEVGLFRVGQAEHGRVAALALHHLAGGLHGLVPLRPGLVRGSPGGLQIDDGAAEPGDGLVLRDLVLLKPLLHLRGADRCLFRRRCGTGEGLAALGGRPAGAVRQFRL